VRRSPVVVLFVAALMAIQATGADLRGRRVLERKYLGFVPSTVYMGLPGPVASLATLPFEACVRVELGRHGCRKMRSVLEAFRDFVMAGLAGLRANIQGRIGWPHVLSLTCRFCVFCCRLFAAAKSEGSHEGTEQNRQNKVRGMESQMTPAWPPTSGN